MQDAYGRECQRASPPPPPHPPRNLHSLTDRRIGKSKTRDKEKDQRVGPASWTEGQLKEHCMEVKATNGLYRIYQWSCPVIGYKIKFSCAEFTPAFGFREQVSLQMLLYNVTTAEVSQTQDMKGILNNRSHHMYPGVCSNHKILRGPIFESFSFSLVETKRHRLCRRMIGLFTWYRMVRKSSTFASSNISELQKKI